MDNFIEKVYFLAISKNGNISHLVSGPFMDWDRARLARETLGTSKSCYVEIVSTKLTFKVE